MSPKLRWVSLLALFISSAGSAVHAQVGKAGPEDFDFKLIPERKIYRQGDEVAVEAIIAVRKEGALGWSYGVDHDENLLDVLPPTTVGTDVPPLLQDGFNETRIVSAGGVNVGWFQAVILSIEGKSQLPVVSRFLAAKAKYQVRSGLCAGEKKEIPTSLVYTDKLSSGGGPPVDINVTVGGESIIPAVLEPAQVVIECPDPGSSDLKFVGQPAQERKLIADGRDLLDVLVSIRNQGSNPVQVQGWSYGLKLDPALLTVTDVTTSPAAAALNGGAGPDFRAYNFNPLDQNSAGTVKGVSVGVVISLDPPNDVLVIPAGEIRQTETVRVKSAVTLPPGQADQSTQLEFVNGLGGTQPIENLIVVEGQSIAAKSDTPSLTVVVTPPPATRPFKRGHANADGRFDIADGIWTILVLFYQRGQFSCQDAADVNDDGRIDLSDAIFTFNYLLQPGKVSGSALFPRPSAPFPACGSDPSEDQLSCETASAGCN